MIHLLPVLLWVILTSVGVAAHDNRVARRSFKEVPCTPRVEFVEYG